MPCRGGNWGPVPCRICGCIHRLHPFLGRRHSEESKKKNSESQKDRIPWNKGRTGVYSEETLIKISESLKGEKSPNYGRCFPKETREKMSKTRSAPEMVEFQRNIAKERWANGGFARVFMRPTSIEILLREFLDHMNIPYSTRKVIDIGYKTRIPDAFIEPNIIIEADGEYYHSEDCHGKNLKTKDEKADKILKEMGYIIYRISESDFRNGNYLETLNMIVINREKEEGKCQLN